MSVTEILIRSLIGYAFIVPGVLLYFFLLNKSSKSQPPLHITATFVFCYYLIGILTVTGIGKLRVFSPRLVLIPFLDMINGPVDTILNVILFVPLGLFLPMLYQKYDCIQEIARTSFLLSLAVELVQMFGRGTTDINDLITNTAGACLGYCLYQLLFKFGLQGLFEKFHAEKIRDGLEVLFFVGYSFAIMVTVQPLIVHWLCEKKIL